MPKKPPAAAAAAQGPAPQARLARFARMLPQLRNDPARRIVRADLRYTNGFAIVWKEVAPPVPPQETNA